MKNIPSMRFYALLAIVLVSGFSTSGFVRADQFNASDNVDASDESRSCGSNSCHACVDSLIVCGDAKVRGDLTVCGKICPEVEGPRGKQGKRGKRGKQGEQAPCGVCEYAYIYNLGIRQEVDVESDILFDSNGTVSPGITHIPGQAQIRVVKSGIYFVSFSVTPGSSNQFAIAVNGTPAPETIYGFLDVERDDYQSNRGTVILSLSAGDVLTIRNHSSDAAVTLPTLIGGTQPNVNAAVTIMQIR